MINTLPIYKVSIPILMVAIIILIVGTEPIIVTMVYSLIIVHVGNLVLYPLTQAYGAIKSTQWESRIRTHWIKHQLVIWLALSIVINMSLALLS
jgi:hypothetical protein